MMRQAVAPTASEIEQGNHWTTWARSVYPQRWVSQAEGRTPSSRRCSLCFQWRRHYFGCRCFLHGSGRQTSDTVAKSKIDLDESQNTARAGRRCPNPCIMVEFQPRPAGQLASRPAGQPASRPSGQPAIRPAGQPASRPAGQAGIPPYPRSPGQRSRVRQSTRFPL